VGAKDLIAECTAILSPKTDPVSDLETAFVMAAVMMELIRQSEQVKGNKRRRKSDTWLITV